MASSNLEELWREPSDCPKCKCVWSLLIKGDVKTIFCANPRCEFGWKAQGNTLLKAVQVWNKICSTYEDDDEDEKARNRPKTPVLIELDKNGHKTTFRTKRVVDVEKGWKPIKTKPRGRVQRKRR